MNTKSIAALACAVAVTAALAGCAASGPAGGTGTAVATHAAATPAAVTAHGLGSTVGSTTGHAPVTVTVPLPAGSHGVIVTVDCPGSQDIIVTNPATSTNRHGTCGVATPILMPVATGTTTAKLDVLAFDGGRAFTVSAVATTTEFQQDAATTTFCAAYSKAYSDLYDADLSFQKKLSTQAKWEAARASGSAELGTIVTTAGTPTWAVSAVASIRTAALAAAPGDAATADGADTELVGIRCDDNSSPVAVNVTVPGEG